MNETLKKIHMLAVECGALPPMHDPKRIHLLLYKEGLRLLGEGRGIARIELSSDLWDVLGMFEELSPEMFENPQLPQETVIIHSERF